VVLTSQTQKKISLRASYPRHQPDKRVTAVHTRDLACNCFYIDPPVKGWRAFWTQHLEVGQLSNRIAANCVKRLSAFAYDVLA
jgi:hypothetical protein